MTQGTIDAITLYDIVEDDSTKYLKIPLNDILKEIVVMYVRQSAQTPVMVMPEPTPPCWEPEEVDDTQSIFVPKKIQAVYGDKATCLEKIVDYLDIVADNWEYRNSGFKKSILKKVAGLKPALNGDMFKIYGKEGDDILTDLVTNNMDYIKNRWKNGNKD